jgi:hypothetical protein
VHGQGYHMTHVSAGRRSSFVTLCAALALFSAAALAGAGGAQAAPPEKLYFDVFDPSVVEVDDFLSDECGTEVTFSAAGHDFGQMFFLHDGDVRFAFHPSYRETLSSEFGTIESQDVGVDKISLDPDTGLLVVFGTGIHLKVKGDTYAIGLWRLTLDPETGEQVGDGSYFGNFDVVRSEILDYVCGILGPPEA